jgi:hypothetical protein
MGFASFLNLSFCIVLRQSKLCLLVNFSTYSLSLLSQFIFITIEEMSGRIAGSIMILSPIVLWSSKAEKVISEFCCNNCISALVKEFTHNVDTIGVCKSVALSFSRSWSKLKNLWK